MRFAKARLIVAVLALFAWIGYVAYQALTYGRFPVVSNAQLLVSTLDVIALVLGLAHDRFGEELKCPRILVGRIQDDRAVGPGGVDILPGLNLARRRPDQS